MNKHDLKKVFLLVGGGILACSNYAFQTGPTVKADPVTPVAYAASPVKEVAPPAMADLSEVKVQNVLFDFDKSTIRPESYEELDRVAELLIANNAALKLGGHADNIGEYVYNWKLSKSRADAVKAYLVKKGADETRIAATEFGDTVPIASNKTAEGRQKNRRVEIEFN